MARKVVFPREVEERSAPGTKTFYVEFEGGAKAKSRTESTTSDSLTVFPFDKDGQPKYDKVKSITFEGLKKRIPRGFVTTWSWGYGFSRYLYPLLVEIEKALDVEHIVISKTAAASFSGKTLTLNSKDLDNAFPLFSVLFKEHRESEGQVASATMNKLLPTHFKPTELKYSKGGLASYIDRWRIEDAALSPNDVNSLTKLLSGKKDLIDSKQILATKQLIEEFYIEDVLDEYEVVLGRAGTGKIEEEWQKFFKEYNWIFGQLFASPVMLFKDKAYVGGKTVEDADGKIADFLYTNSLTKNVSIIEIKTHTTDLLKKTPYRGTDVFSMSDDLSGAIGQVLNQRDNLTKAYFQLSQGGQFETHNTKCVVLIGQIKLLSADQVSSFELFRANSKDVQIFTFDEVLERLKALKDIIKGTSKPKAKVAPKTVTKKSPSKVRVTTRSHKSTK